MSEALCGVELLAFCLETRFVVTVQVLSVPESTELDTIRRQFDWRIRGVLPCVCERVGVGVGGVEVLVPVWTLRVHPLGSLLRPTKLGNSCRFCETLSR